MQRRKDDRRLSLDISMKEPFQGSHIFALTVTRIAAERQSFAVRCNPFGISIIPISIQIRNTERIRMLWNREGTHPLFIRTDEDVQLANKSLPEILI